MPNDNERDDEVYYSEEEAREEYERECNNLDWSDRMGPSYW